MIAALYVETDGCYFGQADVEAWDEVRDARCYDGPHPVVAHPPCQRWGRFWHGSTRKPHQYELGDDKGCFMAALISVHEWGGVIEHPADSQAFAFFGLPIPSRSAGWTAPDQYGGRSCYVEQGNYGHMARKGTWLYAMGVEFLDLNWARGEQRLHPVALARHGYAKARRIGMMAMCGGKDKTKLRNATPPEFRDVLIDIARTRQRAKALDGCNRVPHNVLLSSQPLRRTAVLKFQVIISSDSPQALADLLLSLPDDTGEAPTVQVSETTQAADDNGYEAPAAEPKRRGRKAKDAAPAAPVEPPPSPALQRLAGVPEAQIEVATPPQTAVPLAPVPAAPPAVVAPPSAPTPVAPAPPAPAATVQPIETPAEPTMEQLKDAMTILLGKMAPMEAQAVLKKYTGFGSLVELMNTGKEWAPMAHYVLTNYPNLPESVQPRAV